MHVPTPEPRKLDIDGATKSTATRCRLRRPSIRLLQAADASETVYSVSLSTFESALRWHGSENARLTIRGQVNQTGQIPRALTVFVGVPCLERSAS